MIRGRSPRVSVAAALFAAAGLACAATASPLLAQSGSGGRHAPTRESERDAGTRERIPALLWTRASAQDRLIWGQWTRHLSDTRTHVSNDRIVAVVYRGYFAATFRTTHDEPAFAVGVEREWLWGDRGVVGGSIGFRGGLVYGYDEQLGWLAEDLPILPFLSPMLQGRLGPLALEVTHTWVVVSLTAGVRF